MHDQPPTPSTLGAAMSLDLDDWLIGEDNISEDYADTDLTSSRKNVESTRPYYVTLPALHRSQAKLSDPMQVHVHHFHTDRTLEASQSVPEIGLVFSWSQDRRHLHRFAPTCCLTP
jgi:hypothetical protein